jgi:multicomponent Na+:H+ antiporter subunit E
VVVWCALWSDLSVANVVWGACVGLLSSVLIPLHQHEVKVRVRPLGVLAYVAYAATALVKSSAVVAWEVVTPRNRINQGIVAVPLRIESVAVATLVANTVSLTPGTLTLEIRGDPMTLYVHIMHLRSIEDVRADIGVLEDLAMAAFPPIAPPTASAGSTASATFTQEAP